MRDFYTRVAELLDQGQEFVTACLVRAWGSTPQRQGTRLIVHPNGKTELTIGGGTLENYVTKEALRLFQQGGILVKEYDLEDLGMYCGGAVKVLYEVVGRREGEKRFYHGARELLERGEQFFTAHLVNAVPPIPSGGFKLIIRSDGETESIYGENLLEDLLNIISKEAVALLTSGRGNLLKECSSVDPNTGSEIRVEVFLEVVNRPPRLLIFGAGHVGTMLAKLAAATELFQVEVADDRTDSLEELKPFADEVYKVDRGYRGELPLLDERTFVAIITPSHLTDKIVLQRILGSGTPPAYLGMIGSAKKRAELFRMLIEEGIPKEQLQQVHMPIGLPIGGKEPGEIAVSVLAEVIKVKNRVEE